jgi:hypothetical protein
VREEAEVVTESEEGILMYPHLIFSIQVSQYPSVLSQQPVDIPHKVIGIAVQFVVVIVTALIRTEFLIGTAT